MYGSTDRYRLRTTTSPAWTGGSSRSTRAKSARVGQPCGRRRRCHSRLRISPPLLRPIRLCPIRRPPLAQRASRARRSAWLAAAPGPVGCRRWRCRPDADRHTSSPARRTAGGWSLTGSVPWVTGWGLIDVVHTAAIDDDGAVVWLLVDAATGPSLRADRQRLVAVN